MKNKIKINNHTISSEHYPYIIAELSANHNGDIERAFECIKVAKESGADAVKIQTYTADTMTLKSDRKEFQIEGGIWDGFDLYSLYKWAETPYEWHKTLFDYAKKIGITIFSTPFDVTALDLLEDLNSPVYKIASFEMIDLPLVKCVAQTKKPMIISTGMANLDEINEVVDVARENGCKEMILLHCISSYPAPVNQSNLRTIPDLANRFGVLSGLSDHTIGNTVAVASVALGASIIEKHFTLAKELRGIDWEISASPSDLNRMIEGVRRAEQILGSGSLESSACEEEELQYRNLLRDN